jgi:hypothetical protein
MSAFVYHDLQGRISALEEKVRALKKTAEFIKARVDKVSVEANGRARGIDHELDVIRERLDRLEGIE